MKRYNRVTRQDAHGADPNSTKDTGDETNANPDSKYPGMPRWVKVFGIIVIVLILLFVILNLLGGHTPPVQHGP